VLDTLTYDSYGQVLSESNSGNGDRFKYTAREWDSEIGQYNYRARSYSPIDGRFLNEDPRGFLAGDTDLYRYVADNPTTAIDPTGLNVFLLLNPDAVGGLGHMGAIMGP
jgi:RHS repeat-associated protein